jgi:hypothetical protein
MQKNLILVKDTQNNLHLLNENNFEYREYTKEELKTFEKVEGAFEVDEYGTIFTVKGKVVERILVIVYGDYIADPEQEEKAVNCTKQFWYTAIAFSVSSSLKWIDKTNIRLQETDCILQYQSSDYSCLRLKEATSNFTSKLRDVLTVVQ